MHTRGGKAVVAGILASLISLSCGEGAGPNNIQVVDNAFAPRTTTIMLGTTVTWTWNGSAPHNVLFDQASGIQSSTILTAPASFEARFETPGTYNYSCSLHGGMNGTIIVK